MDSWPPQFKNAVDEAVNKLGDAAKRDAVFCALASDPLHYQKLAKLQRAPAAIDAYLVQLGAQRAPAPTDTPVLTVTVSSADAEAAQREFRDFVGTEVAVYQDRDEGWIVVLPEMSESVRKIGAVISGAACATAWHMSSAAHAATAAAAADTETAAKIVATAKAHLVAAVGGHGTHSMMWDKVYEVGNRAAQAAAHSDQVAQEAVISSLHSTWASRGGAVITVGFLGYAFYCTVRKYWKCEIDGITAAENLTATIMCTGVSFVGGIGAAALCSGAGPAGIVFAAVTGAMLVAGVTDKMVHGIFIHFFGSERDRTLARAYATLGLREDATPQQIRQQYLHHAQVYHPDKRPNGKHEKFIEVNCAYELIRASKLAS